VSSVECCKSLYSTVTIVPTFHRSKIALVYVSVRGALATAGIRGAFAAACIRDALAAASNPSIVEKSMGVGLHIGGMSGRIEEKESCGSRSDRGSVEAVKGGGGGTGTTKARGREGIEA
jgi:hypothetical protein